MNFGFSHLIVNGCSFTYCQGLNNPLEEGWPKLLADKLGIPVTNLAKKGRGNDRIYRTTLNNLYFNNFPNPLYIIAFSHSSRREEYYTKTDDYRLLNVKNRDFDELTDFEKGYVLNFNRLEYAKSKIRYWLGLQNTFKVNNISYLMTDYMLDDYDVLQEVLKTYKPLYDAVQNDPNKVQDLELLTKVMPKLPCGHDDYPAMPVIADYLYKEIEKRWH